MKKNQMDKMFGAVLKAMLKTQDAYTYHYAEYLLIHEGFSLKEIKDLGFDVNEYECLMLHEELFESHEAWEQVAHEYLEAENGRHMSAAELRREYNKAVYEADELDAQYLAQEDMLKQKMEGTWQDSPERADWMMGIMVDTMREDYDDSEIADKLIAKGMDDEDIRELGLDDESLAC